MKNVAIVLALFLSTFLFSSAVYGCGGANSGKALSRCLEVERQKIRVDVGGGAMRSLRDMHVYFSCDGGIIYLSGDSFVIKIYVKTTLALRVTSLYGFRRSGEKLVQLSVYNTDGSFTACFIAGPRSQTCSRELWIN